MAARPMTAKRFATSKLSGKSTADGFLQAHRDFLRGYDFLSPILDAYDNKEILPTPTLEVIQSALMTHFLESELRTQQAKMLERQEKTHTHRSQSPRESFGDDEPSPQSNSYTITLFVKVVDPERFDTVEVGTIEEITGYRILLSGQKIVVKTKEQAEGHPILETLREIKPAVWEAESYSKAMGLADRRLFQREDSVYAEIVNNYDTPITTRVERGDAIARVLLNKHQVATRRTTKTTSTLKWHGRAKQDHSRRSQG